MLRSSESKDSRIYWLQGFLGRRVCSFLGLNKFRDLGSNSNPGPLAFADLELALLCEASRSVWGNVAGNGD